MDFKKYFVIQVPNFVLYVFVVKNIRDDQFVQAKFDVIIITVKNLSDILLHCSKIILVPNFVLFVFVIKNIRDDQFAQAKFDATNSHQKTQ